MEQTIHVESHDGWRKLVLNRPDKLNAVNEDDAGRAAARAGRRGRGRNLSRRAAHRRRPRLLRRSGAGPRGDARSGRPARPGAPGQHLSPPRGAAASARLPLPVVCAVNGVAAGAGASFALACDIVLAARGAQFIQAFVQHRPGAGFRRQLLPRRAWSARPAPARSRCSASRSTPTRADAWGMIWQVVDDAALTRESRGADRATRAGPDRGAGADEAHVRRRRRRTAWTRSSTWKRNCKARPAAPPTTRKACAPSWRSAAPAIPGGVRDRRRTRSPAPAPTRCGRRTAPAPASACGWTRSAPGRARLSMPVTEAMVNGHGICHGGFIFTLADSAFAFACNSHGERTVAQHCAITFLRPGTARRDAARREAVERTRAGRSGIYDVQVTGDDGSVVAEFRGHSRTHGTEDSVGEDEEWRGLTADRNRLARRDRRAAARAPRLDAAPRLRQRAALPRGVRRGRRASGRFPRPGRPARSSRSPPSRTCATTIRSACSPCRASRSCASTPPPAPPASRPWSATRARTSTSGRTWWRARSAPPAGGPA